MKSTLKGVFVLSLFLVAYLSAISFSLLSSLLYHI